MLERLRKLLRQRLSVRMVVYGDSISELGRTPGWFGGASSAENNWGSRVGAMLRADPGAAIEIIHFGIGGQNTYEGLGRLDWLGPMKPDLVLLEFGANDTGFHHLQPEETYVALKSLVEGIEARYGADVVIVGEGGDNPKSPVHLHVDETIAAQRRVADEAGVPFVDLRPAIIEATANGDRWTDFHNGLQDCHPNDKGHAVMAEAVFKVIRQCLPKGPKGTTSTALPLGSV